MMCWPGLRHWNETHTHTHTHTMHAHAHTHTVLNLWLDRSSWDVQARRYNQHGHRPCHHQCHHKECGQESGDDCYQGHTGEDHPRWKIDTNLWAYICQDIVDVTSLILITISFTGSLYCSWAILFDKIHSKLICRPSVYTIASSTEVPGWSMYLDAAYMTLW